MRTGDNLTPLEPKEELPLLVLPDAVMFPGMIMQLELRSPSAVALADHLATNADAFVAVFAQKDPGASEPSAEDIHSIGTIATVVTSTGQDASPLLFLRGVSRARLDEITVRSPFLKARVRKVEEIRS